MSDGAAGSRESEFAHGIVPGTAEPLWRRFAWALTAIWAGNQSTMATDLGVSQPLISKVTRGRQQPGAKLVQSLAERPELNRNWVMTGSETPYLISTASSLAIPIAKRLLPGPPDRHRKLLTGRSLAVNSGDYRPSRYYFQVLVPFDHFRANDFILVETNSNYWRKQPHWRLEDRICVLKIDKKSTLLAKITVEENRARPKLLFSFAQEKRDDPINTYGKNPRHLDLGPRASTLEQICKESAKKSTIVGIVLSLQRSLWR